MTISAPAHSGVTPDLGSRVLEVLRQPMEDKIVTISSAQGSLDLPG